MAIDTPFHKDAQTDAAANSAQKQLTADSNYGSKTWNAITYRYLDSAQDTMNRLGLGDFAITASNSPTDAGPNKTEASPGSYAAPSESARNKSGAEAAAEGPQNHSGLSDLVHPVSSAAKPGSGNPEEKQVPAKQPENLNEKPALAQPIDSHSGKPDLVQPVDTHSDKPPGIHWVTPVDLSKSPGKPNEKPVSIQPVENHADRSLTTALVQPIKIPTVESSRESLNDALQGKLSGKDAAQFKSDMEQFEKRAKLDHLPDTEVAKTYQSLQTLLTAPKGAASIEDLHRLAQQVIHQAAHPEDLRQGASNLCVAASLEQKVYTSNPSAAADLIAQSALSGTYRSHNGLTVQADLIPTYESSQGTDIYSRSYASQIFQEVATNSILKTTEPGMTYNIDHNKSEAGPPGEWLTNAQGQHEKFKGADPEALHPVYEGITGDYSNLTTIEGGNDPDTEGTKHANTPEQMHGILKHLKDDGKLPAIVTIDVRNQPIWSEMHDGGPAKGKEDPEGSYWHAVTVTDYDAKTNTATVHTNWASERQVSVDDLTRAEKPAGENIPAMGRDFVQSLKDGHGNYTEAIDALRLKSETGHISPTDLNKLLSRDLNGLAAQRGKAIFDDPVVHNNVVEIANFLDKHHQTLTLSPTVMKYYQDFMAKNPEALREVSWKIPPP